MHPEDSQPVLMWVVYKPPPSQHCPRARQFRITPPGPPVLTGELAVGPLDILRGYLGVQLGLTRLDRDPDDDPAIIETWW